MTDETCEPLEPYRGLRPYEEKNSDFFFGREMERDIIIYKLRSNKLTLLFAASGVGKSSLLQAAVIPKLKRPDLGDLDVVYYNHWIPEPIEGLKKKTLEVLKQRGKLGNDYPINVNLSLPQFFRVCSAFASEPLVIILDQFEEFFQYHRYKKGFLGFVGHCSACIKDKAAPVVFLISMREDYALELNAFGDYLPTTLFDNYFRLEKLEKEDAGYAVRKPVERLGYRYEPGLLTALLDDLADREHKSQLGRETVTLPKDIPSYVEPPYLQIVCKGLWDIEKTNPDKTIRQSLYRDNGRARGFVDSYFKDLMKEFSTGQKKIASRAFTYLVTPTGTKIAYTAEALNNHLKVNEEDLEDVLVKLRKANILRDKKGNGIVWYELYHDVFSGIIYQWNENFKRKQRTKQVSILAGTSIILFLVIFFYLFFYSTKFYLPPPPQNNIESQVELYKSTGILGIENFEVETIYRHNQLAPDRMIKAKKEISTYSDLNYKMIGRLPDLDKIFAYLDAGGIEEALEMIEPFLDVSDENTDNRRSAQRLLARFGTQKVEELLKKDKNDIVRVSAAEVLAGIGVDTVEDSLIEFLSGKNQHQDSIIVQEVGEKSGGESTDSRISKEKGLRLRSRALMVLGQIGNKKAVRYLIEVLKDKESLLKYEAAEAFKQIVNEQAVEPLIQVLNDSDDFVRLDAAGALGKIGSEQAVKSLILLLDDTNISVRQSAAEALGKISSEQAVKSLILLLKNGDGIGRSSAAWALGQAGSKKAVDPLILALDDNDSDVRRAAAWALGRIDSKKAVKHLLEALKDKDSDVRRAAVCALGQIDSEQAVGPLILALEDRDSIVRQNAARALSQIGSEQAVEPLIEALIDEMSNVKHVFAAALEKIVSKQSVKPLTRALHDKSEYVKRRTAVILGQIGSEEAVQPLIDLLEDDNTNVRQNAAEALGNIGSRQAVQPLIRALKDTNLNVRRAAAWALGQIGSKQALESLIGTIKSKDCGIWPYAALGLGQIGSEQTVDPLIEALNDTDDYVRRCAAWALGNIGSEQAVEPLIRVLKDKDNYVRQNSANSLGKIGSEQAVQPLIQALKDKEMPVKRNAAWALGQIGSEQAVQPLIRALIERYDAVRQRAAFALGRIGSEQALLPLIRALNDDDKYVRQNATFALGRIGSEKAVQPLIRALENESQGYYAAFALSRFGIKRAVGTLIKALKDENPDVQRNVILSLARLSAKEHADRFKAIFNNTKNQIKIRLAAAAALIKAEGKEEYIEQLKRENQLEMDNTDHAIELVKTLGEVPSETGILFLLDGMEELLEELEESSTEKPGYEEPGYDPGKVRESIVEVLAQIVAAGELPPKTFLDTIEMLKYTARNKKELMQTRVKALMALDHFDYKEAVNILMELKKDEDFLSCKVLMTLGKMKPLQSPPPSIAKDLKDFKAELMAKIKDLEKKKTKWRDLLEKDTRKYDEGKKKDWEQQLKENKPREQLEFELAYVIGRIYKDAGVELLSHELANVRQGAWTALGKSKDVSLVKRLSEMIEDSQRPWFRHAAYRVIDNILNYIEVFGGKKELDDLVEFLQSLSNLKEQEPQSVNEKEIEKILDAVQTRTQWTIGRLQEQSKKGR